MKTGRKSLRDELKLMERYSSLTEPYFKVLKKHLESERKDDQRWAADNLKNAFARMIPQDINAEIGGNLTISWSSSRILPENGSINSTNPQNDGLSSLFTGEEENLLPDSTISSAMLLESPSQDSLT